MKEKPKDIFRAYAEDHDLPLFYHPWYLDAASHDDLSWDVAIVKDGQQELEGIWPYYLKSRLGLTTISLPPLTPYLGPLLWIPKDIIKSSTRRSHERKMLRALFNQLPSVSRIITQCHPSWQNWRPLSWEGFHQTTRYTLRLDLRKREDELYDNLRDRLRNHITQAKHHVSISADRSDSEIYELSQHTFNRQGLTVPYSFEVFEAICKATYSRGLGMALTGQEDNKTTAGILVIRDHNTAFLLSTGRTKDAHSGAVALLIWESIIRMKKQGVVTFDFEGSMIEGIATFFDGFGGELVPYHRLTKVRTKYHRALYQLFDKI